jgi:hypothetical protein
MIAWSACFAFGCSRFGSLSSTFSDPMGDGRQNLIANPPVDSQIEWPAG